MHAHTSEMPVGSYKKGTATAPGAHVFAVTGSGYTLMWNDGDAEFERHEWRHGFVFAPPDGMFHQHFNTGAEPARYLADLARQPPLSGADPQAASSSRRPTRRCRTAASQVDYEDQDPRIHAIWLRELAKTGVSPRAWANISTRTAFARRRR